jgi:membrane protease YdiL (CAAX protease family)
MMNTTVIVDKTKNIEMSNVNTAFTVAPRYTTLPSLVGLVFALVGPFVWQWFIGPAVEAVVAPVTLVLLGQGFLWLLALSVFAITMYWERNPLTSLGVRSLKWQMGVMAVVLGIVLSVAIPLLGALASHLFPASEGGTIQSTSTNAPAWLLLIVVVTASVTEEILFRAYPLEHMTGLTGNMWLGVVLALGAFVTVHVQGWTIAHVLGVVLPGGAIMAALYAWRRNLIFNILVHFLINLPLVLIAAGILPPL